MQNSFKFPCKYNKRGVYQRPLLLLRETGRGRVQLQRRWGKKTARKYFYQQKVAADRKCQKIQGQKKLGVKRFGQPTRIRLVPSQRRTVHPSHPAHSLRPWPMCLGLSRGVCLGTPSHLLRLPLSARELREPSEPW